MNTKNIIALAVAGLMAMPVIADEDATPQVGDILQDINMFNPEDGDPAYKVKANEKYGTQWGVDVAYGYWGTHNAAPSSSGNANFALIHAQLNQRLIQDDLNGGTWLRVEFSGSWGLDKRSAHGDKQFYEAYGTATDVHADMFGGHNAGFPEIALMQYFANKRACIIAGMVNLTNYFDAVGIANDSFSNFTNTGFVNSSVLPLPDSNVGAIAQVELTRRDYVMGAVSRTTSEMGYDPFNSTGKGYCVVGEYGHIFGDGTAVVRLNPFFTLTEEETEDGTRTRRNAGLAGSIEYTPVDAVTLFVRAGFGAKQDLGAAADFSVGANFKLIPSREDDFLGIAYGVFKGQNTIDEPTEHSREQVIEVMYSCQVTDYFKIVPHFQYIHNPAYRSDCRDETLVGVQAVFSF